MMSAATPFNRPIVATLAGIEPSRRIIPAAEVAELERIATAAIEPERRIEAAEAKAREGLGRIVHAGWQRGFARGHAEALNRLQEFLAALSERRKNVDAELIGLVADAVTRIVRRLPPDILTESLIQAALDEVQGERGRAVLRIHPERVTVAETWLRERPPAQADGLSIVIEADSAMGRDDCTLETSNGVVETGLDVQLEALRAALFAST
jgi:type III secretion protein L